MNQRDATPRGLRWAGAAVAALVVAWLLAPAAVPIYDGLSNPDEPYRYVQPPANAQTTKTPTSAKAIVPVRAGESGAQFANTAEQAPQLSLYLPGGALRPPSGVTSVTVAAVPAAPSPPLPKDGHIVGNVYRISATASGRPVSVVSSGRKEPSLQMRAPTAQQPGPVFEHRAAAGWQQAKTIRVGQDLYQAQAPALGDWALVQLASQPSTKSGGINGGLLAAGIAVLVVAAIILAIRLRRSRSTS